MSNEPKIDRSKLSVQELYQLDQWQASRDQLAKLTDVAEALQKVQESIDKGNNGDVTHLLKEVRASIDGLASKEQPEMPDYAKPITEALGQLETSLKGALAKIDVKPIVNVEAPATPAAPDVNVPAVDLSGVEKVLKNDVPAAFKEAIALIPVPKLPNNAAALAEISEKLSSIDVATRLIPAPPKQIKVTNPDGTPIGVTIGAVTNDGSFALETGGNLATIAGKDFATQTTLATRLSESDFDTKVGILTESAPATDTASSGLNGRLQRISQRLTSLIALLPGSLGQKARAASLAVTLSSEDITALTPPAAITGFATSAKQDNLLTELQLKADLTETQPVSLVSVPTHGVTGPLTDTQLRATPVPVSGTVDPTTPSTVLGFVTTVATAGVRVQLASNACVAGIVQAPSTNTGIVYVGGSNVSASVYGSELQPGQAAGIAINNTNKLYVDAATNGDKLAFLGS